MRSKFLTSPLTVLQCFFRKQVACEQKSWGPYRLRANFSKNKSQLCDISFTECIRRHILQYVAIYYECIPCFAGAWQNMEYSSMYSSELL